MRIAMVFPDRPAHQRSSFPTSIIVCVLVLLASAAIAVLAPRVAAQASRRQAPALQQAARAYVEGRYDEVDQLTDKLDSRDPNVVALKAQAGIARGRYGQAEALLRPVAGRAPVSEAALQLGLLQQMLGRSDAAAILEKVAEAGERTDEAVELARAARAMRALRRFHEANDAYREA